MGLRLKQLGNYLNEYCDARKEGRRMSRFAGRTKYTGSQLGQSRSLRRSAVHSLTWIYLIHQKEPPFFLVYHYLYECALGRTSVVRSHSYRKRPLLHVKVITSTRSRLSRGYWTNFQPITVLRSR